MPPSIPWAPSILPLASLSHTIHFLAEHRVAGMWEAVHGRFGGRGVSGGTEANIFEKRFQNGHDTLGSVLLGRFRLSSGVSSVGDSPQRGANASESAPLGFCETR
jgi:hypothetical protein